jgi:hypothetical protein
MDETAHEDESFRFRQLLDCKTHYEIDKIPTVTGTHKFPMTRQEARRNELATVDRPALA